MWISLASLGQLEALDGWPVLKAIAGALVLVGTAIAGTVAWSDKRTKNIVNDQMAQQLPPLQSRILQLERNQRVLDAAVAESIGHLADGLQALPQVPANEPSRGHFNKTLAVLTKATVGTAD